MVHIKDADDNWSDIDNTLKEESDPRFGKAYVARNGNRTVAFPAESEDVPLCDVQEGKYHVRMSLSEEDASNRLPAEVLPSAGKTNEDGDIYQQISLPNLTSSIIYKNAAEGVDLEYTLYGLDLKEQIVMREPQDSCRYVFDLELENLFPVLDEKTGTISLMDGDRLIYEMPAPYMSDAMGSASSGAAYELAQVSEGKYVLAINADEKWVNAKERVFPITIDPTLFTRTSNTEGPITTTYVRSGSPDSAQTDWQHLYIGSSSLSSEGYCQIYLNVNTLPSIPKNCEVIDAQIALGCTNFSTTGASNSASLYAYEIYDGNASSYSTRRNWIRYMTWNTRPDRYDNALDCRTLYASDVGTYVAWDVVRAAKKWFATRTDTTANHAMKLQATDLTNYVVIRFNGYGTGSPTYFITQYRNVVGLEDYYTYQTQSVDRAGDVYINDYTQQLTLVHPDVTLQQGVMGLSLYHVYNSAYRDTQTTYAPTEGLHARTFTTMKTGLGWKLSAQETIDWCTVGDTNYLVYSDPDGTEHYFAKNTSTGKWEDEDGLNLFCTVTGSDPTYTFTLTNKNGDYTKVFYNGYLTSITDANGNKQFYAYGTSYNENSNTWKPSYSNHQLKEIVQQVSGGNAVVAASFDYNNDGLLTAITDYADRVTSFEYDDSNRLISITHPDATQALYTYGSTTNRLISVKDGESSYSLSFTHTINNTGGAIITYVVEKAVNSSNTTITGESYTLILFLN